MLVRRTAPTWCLLLRAAFWAALPCFFAGTRHAGSLRSENGQQDCHYNRNHSPHHLVRCLSITVIIYSTPTERMIWSHMNMQKGSSGKWTNNTEFWLKQNTGGCPADFDAPQAILFLAWILSATLCRAACSKPAKAIILPQRAMQTVCRSWADPKCPCYELSMGAGRKYPQVVASCAGLHVHLCFLCCSVCL